MDVPQSQTFTVKVNPDGGAVTDDTPALPAQQEDFRNNPDYVPDDPVGDEGETNGTEPETEPQDPAPQHQQPSDADLQQRLDTNATDIQTGDAVEIELATITWSKNLALEDTDLGDGDYLYRYIIEDLFGNISYSDPVLMHYEGGKIEVRDL